MGDSKKRHLAIVGDDRMSRRAMLGAVGAGTAAAAAGCERARPEDILPYTKTPRHVTPGIPRQYATSLTLDGFATGVLVLCHEGRPTKVEGNPDHPASLGATSAIEQASVLGLYGADRARSARTPEGPATFEAIAARFGAARPDRGERLRFLLDPEGSPLVADLVGRVRSRLPRARFTFWSATRHGFAEEGARIATGARAQPVLDFSAARVVLSLDDDFLARGPFALRYARQFAAQRRPSERGMVRLYVAETMMSPTGTLADHRLARKPSEIAVLAAQVAAEVAALSPPRPAPAGVAAALARFRAAPADARVIAIARDLVRNARAAVVTAGAGQPPIVHAMAQLIHGMLDAEGTWNVAPTLVTAGDGEQDLPALAAEIDAGAVDTLVILAHDPVYSAPPDLDLARRIAKVADVLYLGAHEDATAAHARWFVPLSHPFESWGDARAYDGTISIVQPLIAPLHGGRTVADALAIFTGSKPRNNRMRLWEHWASRESRDFDAQWRAALTAGVVAGTAAPRLARNLDGPSVAAALAATTPPQGDAMEIRFAPDPHLHDGRFASNAWLLELPQPITKITWDNAALLGPRTAARLGVTSEDVVELSVGNRRVRAPAFIVPGHAEDAVTVNLGWGRTGTLGAGAGVGFDAHALTLSTVPGFMRGVGIRKIPWTRHDLARSQLHMSTEGRELAPATTLAELRAHPDLTQHLRGPEPAFFGPPTDRGEQWAMTIDTSICTGCSACVTACQAENNILVVGKEEVRRGRLMHWIRIDTYFHGPEEAPRAVQQPMLCQHCELAPCEYVCPVNATVHSGDGLNEMVYNRCVGTRFCSNNCPYKVRRFNWFDFGERQAENGGLVTLQRNPEVTVRQRGVMEKCTYCVQRIRGAEIRARVEDRAIRPGEVVTACQQACPTEAIQFGSLSHEDTRMARWRREARSFEVLHHLGTRPRTVYLARVDDPNPEMP